MIDNNINDENIWKKYQKDINSLIIQKDFITSE